MTSTGRLKTKWRYVCYQPDRGLQLTQYQETEDRPINRYDLESLGQYLQDKEAEAFSVEQDEIQLPEPPRLRRLW
jgi:hypothetical protein